MKEYINKLNKIKGNIKFTYEWEKNGKINFLDTTLTRDPSKENINIRWFRKNTAANRLLNFHSCHEKSIKINIAKNMLNRIMETTSNKEELKQDINKLNNILENSNYPPKLIQQITMDTLTAKTIKRRENQQKTATENQDHKEYIMYLPYVPGIEVLRRKLSKINIKLYYSYPNKLQSILNSTQQRPKSLVYQIQCECEKIYNGETKIGLNKRMKQHEELIRNNDENSYSEIVQHHIQMKHQCSFNIKQAFVIEKEINWKVRRIKEAIYSHVNQSINKRDELYKGWIPIMHSATPMIKRSIEQKRNSTLNI